MRPISRIARHLPDFSGSLRTKLIGTFIAVILFGGTLTLLIGLKLFGNTVFSLAQAKVKHDLASAGMVYQQKVSDLEMIVNLTANREGILRAVRSGDTVLLEAYLSRIRQANSLDILTLTDENGRVILRTRNPEVLGDDQSGDELVGKALEGQAASGTEIVPRDELLKEDKDLAERAKIEFIETPMAADRVEELEEDGMMLKAAAPLISEGDLLGVLYGGVLLNRNYEIVDEVKGLVFKGEKYKGRETGTATIFQQDLRISTNVKNSEGRRAIGTRVSAAVNDAVLKEGRTWTDRAFVVNDWYITAYEPIRDISGEIVGILYVGMLEKPYVDLRNRMMLTFVGVAFFTVLVLFIILYFSTTRIVKPLQDMAGATKQIARGDLTQKITTHSRDEIGVLAKSFNHMVDDLKNAREELTEWGRTLEKKVEERTREVHEMQDHLIQSEKLASLGKLAAGIAHEINNPLGGILMYSHLLLEDTGDDSPAASNIKKIIRDTTRCKDIVRGLLEFSRAKEPQMALVDMNGVVDSSLVMMAEHELFQNIQIDKSYSESLPQTVADSAQLQQVFLNIILNAAEAMEGRGRLSIRTRLDSSGENVEVAISDDGCGISKEDMARIFDPFFTTKPVGKGTGLGMAISYGIVKRHGGDINVESQPGVGTTFTVRIPCRTEV
jgi:two-component system NtrC family sensor kinase